jgi:Family of unknown function (DUF6437)
MARARTGALDALRKLEAEKRTLQSREQELRMEAAQELGQAVLDGGGLMLSPADVASIIAAHLKAEKRPKAVHDDHPDRVAA